MATTMNELKKYRMLAGGQWVEPASGAWFESVNPYTAEPWALVPRGTQADMRSRRGRREVRVLRGRMAQADGHARAASCCAASPN